MNAPEPSAADVKVSASLEELAAGVEDVLRDIAGKKYGFALFAFPLSESTGYGSYVSNADPKDFVSVLTSLQWRLAARVPMTPAHEIVDEAKKSQASKDAQAGTMAGMWSGYQRTVLASLASRYPGNVDPECSRMDFFSGAKSLTLLLLEQNRDGDIFDALEQLRVEIDVQLATPPPGVVRQ